MVSLNRWPEVDVEINGRLPNWRGVVTEASQVWLRACAWTLARLASEQRKHHNSSEHLMPLSFSGAVLPL